MNPFTVFPNHLSPTRLQKKKHFLWSFNLIYGVFFNLLIIYNNGHIEKALNFISFFNGRLYLHHYHRVTMMWSEKRQQTRPRVAVSHWNIWCVAAKVKINKIKEGLFSSNKAVFILFKPVIIYCAHNHMNNIHVLSIFNRLCQSSEKVVSRKPAVASGW